MCHVCDNEARIAEHMAEALNTLADAQQKAGEEPYQPIMVAQGLLRLVGELLAAPASIAKAKGDEDYAQETAATAAKYAQTIHKAFDVFDSKAENTPGLRLSSGNKMLALGTVLHQMTAHFNKEYDLMRMNLTNMPAGLRKALEDAGVDLSKLLPNQPEVEAPDEETANLLGGFFGKANGQA